MFWYYVHEFFAYTIPSTNVFFIFFVFRSVYKHILQMSSLFLLFSVVFCYMLVLASFAISHVHFEHLFGQHDIG